MLHCYLDYGQLHRYHRTCRKFDLSFELDTLLLVALTIEGRIDSGGVSEYLPGHEGELRPTVTAVFVRLNVILAF